MKTKLKMLMLVAGLSSGLALLTGCLAAAAGGAAAGYGAVEYENGEMDTDIESPQARVILAVNEAVKNLGYIKRDERSELVETTVKAETLQGKPITILTRKVNDNATHVSIRVGTFGDEELSQKILNEIKSKL